MGDIDHGQPAVKLTTAPILVAPASSAKKIRVSIQKPDYYSFMAETSNSHILFNQGTNAKADAVLGLLRRAGINVKAREFQGDHLPEDVPGGETHDLILLFADAPGQINEPLLRQLQTSRRDLPCLLICKAPARWLPMLNLGAAALISESQLESASGQVQFVYHVRRELEHLRGRREARRSASNVRELHQRLQMLTDHTSDAIACVQDGLHLSANKAWLNFFGVHSVVELHSIPFLDLVADEDVERVRQFLRLPFSTGNQRYQFLALRRDGSEIIATLDSAAVTINGVQSLQLIIKDANGNAFQENAARNAKGKDLHSGLLNESGLTRLINQSISCAVHTQRCSAVIVLSFANLADIAVVLGKTDVHVLMRDIATALTEKCPAQAVLGRLDAGDFIILAPDADAESCAALMKKLEDLPSALKPMIPPGLALTVNLGLAMITDEAPDAETILIRARQHQAFRAHQSHGKDSEGTSSAMLELLRQALHDETLLLVYQPTVSLKADIREHYEIDIRLFMTDRSVCTEEFLETANQYGYAERIDRYVITHALRVLNKNANENLRLTINLSANSILSQTLMLWLTQELQRQNQSSRQLILQISELDIMSAPETAEQLCQQIRDLGFELSLTHFGCSLDSFRLLGIIQADYVKLDNTLLRTIAVDTGRRELLHDIVGQLQSQSIRVIAPMIEDIELLPLLWQANVNFVQGNCLQQSSEHLAFGLFQEQEISVLPPMTPSGLGSSV